MNQTTNTPNNIQNVNNVAGNAINNTAQQSLQEGVSFIDTILSKIPYFIASVFVVFLGIILANIVRNTSEKLFARISDRTEAINLIGKSAYIGIIALSVIISFNIMGIKADAIFGAFGFGVGFALKDLISNYIAGVMILLQEPFVRGDKVELDGEIGYIDDIESNRVALRTLAGHRIFMSSSSVLTSKIKNFSKLATKRVDVEVDVAYGTDLEAFADIAIQVAKNVPKVLKDPEPSCKAIAFASSGITFRVSVWVDRDVSPIKMKSELLMEVYKQMNIEGITIPYNTITLDYKNGDSEDSVKTTKKQEKKEVDMFSESAKGDRNMILNKSSVNVEKKKEINNVENNNDLNISNNVVNNVNSNLENKNTVETVENKNPENTVSITNNVEKIEDVDNINKPIDNTPAPNKNTAVGDASDIFV